jgi:hypothetical protein
MIKSPYCKCAIRAFIFFKNIFQLFVRILYYQRLLICNSNIKQFKFKKTKKLILTIEILSGIALTATAQTSSNKVKSEKQKMEMKTSNGLLMTDNKVMLYKDNKCTPLKETYTCTDGCKVSTDGIITKPDGTSMKLMNGYKIEKDGKVAMIPHGQPGHVCGPDCPMNKKM